jgi:aspartate racemase
VFSREYGLETVVPGETEQDLIDDVILKVLSLSRFISESRQAYLEIIDPVVSTSVENVILGCTEIGLLVSQEGTGRTSRCLTRSG